MKLGMQRGLIADMEKGFCYTNSSFSLSRADKVLSTMNVYRGELNRMTTKGFIEVRIMPRVKPRDCGNAITSRSCNIASCKVSIK
jgi:hypothetical protein